jgi:hypothetical protein
MAPSSLVNHPTGDNQAISLLLPSPLRLFVFESSIRRAGLFLAMEIEVPVYIEHSDDRISKLVNHRNDR